MNAKKVTTLLLCGAGIAMLAACSGKGVTRADSEKLLTDMDTAIKADTFKAPTKVSIVTQSTEAAYSNDDFYAHKKYSVASSYTDSSSNKVTINASTEAWVYVKDGVAIYAVDDGTNKQYAEGIVEDAKKVVSGKLTAQVTSMKGNPAYICSYLKKFDNLTSTSNYSGVTAGATDKGSIMGIKDENYTSSGAGYLDAKWTSVYPKETPADEPLEYKYEKNMLVYTYNGKSNSHTTYSWDQVTPSYIDTAKFTKITDVAAVLALGVSASALC